jgi:hypothetical protein
LAVECKKTFFDIAYGFPVIVMRRVGPPKKKLPKEVVGSGNEKTSF